MMKKTGTRKTSSLGYMIVGTLVVIAVLFCVLAITGSLAPLVLRIHAADAPAMMTMPVFVYCIFADFILLEIIFLVYLPGVRKFIDGDRDETMQKKALPLSVIVTIVCCVLLLCSILIAPNVCHVMTEQGVDSYVFFKTDSHAWQDIPLYELTFSRENGLELYLYFAKDDKIPMLGSVTNSFNQAFTEQYGGFYGFACKIKEIAVENGCIFKVVNAEAIESYYKDLTEWEYIEKLIQ
jgi:hypothetical protein